MKVMKVFLKEGSGKGKVMVDGVQFEFGPGKLLVIFAVGGCG